MIVKNDYNNCLTNLACSIRKYFGLEYHHQTLNKIDELLNDNPRNVILILFDGMGSRILDRTLDTNSFFRSNKLDDMTTVFPATTTAATTSVRTGLNPVEHGWLGWNMYIHEIDKIITLFLNVEKDTKEINEDFIKLKSDILVTQTIVDEINTKTQNLGCEIMPFGSSKYNSIDEMFSLIEERAMEPGKKFIYAYDTEPDSTMHHLGPDSNEAKEIIIDRSKRVSELCNRLDDSVVIVVADHGHLKVDNILLKNYPDLLELMERNTSIDQRAISFKIKEGYQEEFVKRFNKDLGMYFKLYPAQEVIDSKLFGDGQENGNFRYALGDFIAIGENSNKTIISHGDQILFSQHAGYTDDEIYVPLIAKKLVKK